MGSKKGDLPTKYVERLASMIKGQQKPEIIMENESNEECLQKHPCLTKNSG